jgi:hypothetical protein
VKFGVLLCEVLFKNDSILFNTLMKCEVGIYYERERERMRWCLPLCKTQNLLDCIRRTKIN